MANRTLQMNDALYDYLLGHGLREPEILHRLREATEAEELSIMCSAPEQGQLMAMLIRLMGAHRVLEIGTYTGYATLWMALALPEHGHIVTCDVSERWSFVARRYWEEAGIEGKIALHLRPALETLDHLVEERAEPFDFAFIDADKINYEDYFERCLKLLRPGGLIVVDNVLWSGDVIDAGNREASTEAIRAFNTARHSDERIDLCMLPVADGVTLAIKR